jgi:excisionase family DNA binding protein
MSDTTLRPPGAGALVRVPEAARRLGIGLPTKRAMIASGSIEVIYVHPTAHPRVRAADLDALVRGEKAAGP